MIRQHVNHVEFKQTFNSSCDPAGEGSGYLMNSFLKL